MNQSKRRKSKKNYEPIVNLDSEVWKPIKGYEGLYEVSNKGRVKSLNYRSHKGVVRVLSPHPNKGGYQTVSLTKNGKRKTKQIHRLVYSNFITEIPIYNPKDKSGNEIYEINHIDENKANNNIENLELITHTQNVNHGTSKIKSRAKLINGPKSKQVYQYTKEMDLVRIWSSGMECNRNGFCNQNISTCCNGRRKTYKGYIWSLSPLSKNN